MMCICICIAEPIIYKAHDFRIHVGSCFHIHIPQLLLYIQYTVICKKEHAGVYVFTSAKCEGGDGVDGEVVKVTEGDQSLCPASLIAWRKKHDG